MSFKVKHGDIGSVVKLATLAGEAEAGIRAEKMAFDSAQRLRELEHSTKLAEMQVDARMAAKEQDINFELQKYAMTQQNNFMVREEIRMDKIRVDAVKQTRRVSEHEAVVSSIEAQVGETINREQADRMIRDANNRFAYGGGVSAERQQQVNPLYEMRQQAKEQAEAQAKESAKQPPTPEEFRGAAQEGKVIFKVVQGPDKGVYKAMTVDEARYDLSMGDIAPVTVPEEAVSGPVRRSGVGGVGGWAPQYPVPEYLKSKTKSKGQASEAGNGFFH